MGCVLTLRPTRRRRPPDHGGCAELVGDNPRVEPAADRAHLAQDGGQTAADEAGLVLRAERLRVAGLLAFQEAAVDRRVGLRRRRSVRDRVGKLARVGLRVTDTGERRQFFGRALGSVAFRRPLLERNRGVARGISLCVGAADDLISVRPPTF